MNSKEHKCCAVPMCRSSSTKTPDKLFVFVPKSLTIRYKWLKLARRDTTTTNYNSRLHFCEDHFDMPNDMKNYKEYYDMGSVSQVQMYPGCMPTKFECQTEICDQILNGTKRYWYEKKRKAIVKESGKDLEERMAVAKCKELRKISADSLVSQAHIGNKSQECQSTSQFKIKRCITANNSTCTLHELPTKQFTIEVQYDRNIYTAELAKKSLQKKTKLCEDNSEFKHEASITSHSTVVAKVLKNPLPYIGVPESCRCLIELIKEETNIPVKHILMCLKKIKSNQPFKELADIFSMTPTNTSNVFLKTIPNIASFMRAFIVQLDAQKSNLPVAFRHKYHTINCIIDSLEIELENQSQTTSEYTKPNTVKYLVSYTPKGLVNYISPGYRGTITDKCLLEACGFVKSLQPGMSVMADEELKHLEQYLWRAGVQLVWPPSVNSGAKLLESEARETKQNASIRTHVERVIRRLREFNMLKRHSHIDDNLVKVLDDVIIIACGLINLQDLSIK